MGDGTPFFDVTSSGKVKIYTKRLVTVIIGLLAAPTIQGAMNLIDTLLDAFLINPIAFFAAILGDIVRAIFPDETIRIMFRPLINFVSSLGPLGFPGAILVVLLLAYIVVIARDIADG